MNYTGFIGPSFASQSFIEDQEDLTNWYLENSESEGATTRSCYMPTPGVQVLSEAAVGPGRANFAQQIHILNGEIQVLVIGESVYYTVGPGGGLNLVGTVATDDNPATISSNGDGGNQIFITSGDNGYIFDISTFLLTQVRTGATTQGGFLDGYFLAFDASSSTFYVSDLLDGTTWDPTQFAQRSIAPDPWVSMYVANRYIYLLGSQTSEVWYNAGTFPFPFAPHPSGYFQFGCSAPFSPAVCDGNVAWVGGTQEGGGFILSTPGFQPQPISTAAITYAINQYSRINDALGFSYSQDGHTFYVLTFPTANVTWAYDFKTGQWAKRGTWLEEYNRFDAWRPCWPSYAFGQNTMLDRSSGAFYQISSSFGLDVEGRELRRVRRGPAIVNENKRLYYAYFELLMDVGLGLATGPDADVDPQVMLRYSNDGGRNWSNELWRSAGKIGEYGIRVRWNRLGNARKRTFEVSTSYAVPPRLVGAAFGLGRSEGASG